MKRSCKQFQELIISLRDGDTLSRADREALEHHLAECPHYREFERDIAQVFEDIEMEILPSLDEKFFRGVREDILNKLTAEPPVKSPRWGRIFENLLPPSPWCRGIFVPVLSGAFGIFLGIIIATTWQQDRQFPQQKISKMPVKESSVSTASNTQASSDIIDVVEDYVMPGDLLEDLDDQEMQALLGELSDELPESVLGDTVNGTG